MLYITIKINGQMEDWSWHVGEDLNLNMRVEQVYDVVSVYADCDERLCITANFENLPRTLDSKDHGELWFGDQAKQIVAYLMRAR